jgi:hypothetical protein
MTATDFEKFIKLMMMTTSDQDHEALVALRKANAIIAGMNNNWEEVLRGKVKVTGTAQQQHNANYVHHTNATEIDAMFETLLRTVPRQSSFRDFVEDVHGYWENRGYLTDAQYKALKRAMERTR